MNGKPIANEISTRTSANIKKLEKEFGSFSEFSQGVMLLEAGDFLFFLIAKIGGDQPSGKPVLFVIPKREHDISIPPTVAKLLLQ